MLCTMMPGGVSAVKQIRAAGIKAPILNGSGMDGSYWLSAVPDLSSFFVPAQGSVPAFLLSRGNYVNSQLGPRQNLSY